MCIKFRIFSLSLLCFNDHVSELLPPQEPLVRRAAQCGVLWAKVSQL